PVDIGDGTEIERLRERVEALDGTRIQLAVSLRGATRALKQLAALEAAVAKLDGRNINIRIDVDGLAGALTQLVTFGGLIKALPTGSGGPIGRLNRNFLRMATRIGGAVVQVGQLAVSMLRVTGMATGIAIAGAAITAAWGGISALIATIPAAIALIGVPLALVLADTEELGKRIGDLSPKFQQLRKDIAGALAEGLAPALETLAGQVLPKVGENLTGIARTMGELAQQAAAWLATTEGVNLLNGVLTNVKTTIEGMKPGLADIGRAFLELANQASAFDVLSGAVNAFGESFRANVTSLIADGRLQSAFEGLKGVLSELARGFSDLVHNGIRVFAAAAPGIENFLNKLRDFFNRFDWERIGAAVGGVFDGLAETLSKIPQGTIDNITAAFERLSQTFQNPAIQQMFVNIISAAPMAINAINNMVQAFARAGSFLTGLANAIQGTINVIGTAIQAAGDPVGLLAGKYSQAFSEAQAQIALGSTQIQQAFASLNQ